MRSAKKWGWGGLLLGLLWTLVACPVTPPILERPNEPTSGLDASVEFPENEPRPEPAPVFEALQESVAEQPPPEPGPPVPFPSTYAPIVGGTILKDENPDPNIVEVTLVAKPSVVQVTDKHRIEVYTYNDLLPGPIIEAKIGDQLIVHFTNKLMEPTTVHWHGQRVPEAMDGAPLVQTPVAPGGTFTYKFTIRDAGTYWYHPHVHSHEQVEKGLYGMLVVREKTPIAFDRERAIILDDILLTETGLAPFHQTEDEKLKGRIGSQLLTNGRASPMVVQAKVGERERWRLVNTANARVLKLSIKGDGARVRVIGVDSGLLTTPLAITGALELSPGQRYDLEVMYEKPGDIELIASVAEGRNFVDYPMFRAQVTGDRVKVPLAVPMYPKVEPLPQRKVTRKETLTFHLLESPDPGGNHWALNGQVHPQKPLFRFKVGDVVDITLHNLANPNHPFHLHGQFFEIISRNEFPVSKEEPGLRDTVLVTIQERVVIRAYLDNPGKWMFHCHNLEHAAFGMMAHIVVEP